jgi:tetratricopeptide (TPR) repeat protein
LANIARSKNDETKAEEYYKKIVSIDPADSVAHVTLGYLYYLNPRDNTLAYRHFKKYLELQPDAPDREAIENILAEL